MNTPSIMASRRQFLETTSAAAIGSIAAFAWPSSVHAAGSDVLKVGLIGCGGRGSGAAREALQADQNVKLWAMGDAFEDRLEASRTNLQKLEALAPKIDVPRERRFVGFDAYKDVISCCDVVLLCTPPHFRPLHLKAAVDAGRHIFAEKPVAVDAPGVRRVLEICEEAKAKRLSIVSGLCLRYDYGFRDTIRRIHDGAVGDVVAIQTNDLRSGRWAKPRQADWSDMTYAMRNWYNFTWLSGDFNVEQHVHYLDVCSWVMNNTYPVRAVGLGGRQVLTGPEYGNVYDHFSVTYEYENGARVFSGCRQQPGCLGDMSAHVMGSKGSAKITERRKGLVIKSSSGDWTYDKKENNVYQTEHDELFASIRSGNPINNGEYMAKSSLMGIMGRMAAYTGQAITWDMAMKSKEDLSPSAYNWNVAITPPPVAIPGVTKFS